MAKMGKERRDSLAINGKKLPRKGSQAHIVRSSQEDTLMATSSHDGLSSSQGKRLPWPSSHAVSFSDGRHVETNL